MLNPPIAAHFSMRRISSDKSQNVLVLLDAGHPVRHISSVTGISTGTISKLRSTHRPHLLKNLGGRPSKLSSANIRHAQHLITSQKAENAVQITKTLGDMVN